MGRQRSVTGGVHLAVRGVAPFADNIRVTPLRIIVPGFAVNDVVPYAIKGDTPLWIIIDMVDPLRL